MAIQLQKSTGNEPLGARGDEGAELRDESNDVAPRQRFDIQKAALPVVTDLERTDSAVGRSANDVITPEEAEGRPVFDPQQTTSKQQQEHEAAPLSKPKGGLNGRMSIVLIASVIILLAGAGAWMLLRPGTSEGPTGQRDALPPTATEQESPTEAQAIAAEPDVKASDAPVGTEQEASSAVAPQADQAAPQASSSSSVPSVAAVRDKAEVGAVEAVKTSSLDRSGIPSAGPYRIIAGAFRSANNAAALAEKLQAAGYPTEVRPQSNGFHMVVLSRHSSKEDATSALEDFRSATGSRGYISRSR